MVWKLIRITIELIIYVSQDLFINLHGPSPSRAYCIFGQLTNSKVLRKLPILDSYNGSDWKLYTIAVLVNLAKMQHTHDGEEPDF